MKRLARSGRGDRRRFSLETLEPRLVLDASMLRITEFLASNDNGITDAEGDNPDWIEIYNSGAEQVDLSGMYLTDDAEELDQWSFPQGTSLDAGGYLVVFASNKNGVLPGGELHTNFAISAGGEYLAIVDSDGSTVIDSYAPEFPEQYEDISYGRAMALGGVETTIVGAGAEAKALIPDRGDIGTSWQTADYNDDLWPISGTTGVGYENSPGSSVNFAGEIGTTIPSGTTSVFIRVEFELDTLSGIDQLLLRMKYDDGFVAYINGVQVAEANAPDAVAWNSIAATTHADQLALQYEDFNIGAAIPSLRVGANVLAIHGLNVQNSSDMLISPELVTGSMAIITPEEVGYFSQPTPGYGNGDSVTGFAQSPEFSTPHGFYESAQTVAITSPTPDAVIVYTTDGSAPEVDANLNILNGIQYTEPLTISSTTTLRARTFQLDFEPSPMRASSYLFVDDILGQSPNGQTPDGWVSNGYNGQQFNYGIDPQIVSLYGAEAIKQSLLSAPSVMLTMDLDDLLDSQDGIYVNAGNRGRSWERPASLEMINPDGSDGFESNAGVRIRGGFSRSGANPKHAFRLYFRGEYGDSKLEFPLFGDAGADEFDKLDLRTSQNYSWAFLADQQNTFVREVFGRDLQRDMGQPYTRSTYYHLYINGQYWGIYQSQERVDEDFGESYFGGDETDYDVVKSGLNTVGGTEVNSGNDEAWRQLFEYGQALAQNPSANADVFWTMQGLNPDGTRNPELPVLLDAENVIDYMIVLFYTGGYDSGLSRFRGNNEANNWFGIYNRAAADEGFQFFIHDNEHSMGAEANLHGTINIDRTGPFNNGNQNNYSQFNPQYLHQDLLASPEYKQLFIDRVQLHFFNDGVLTTQNNTERFLNRAGEVDLMILGESARWGDSKRSQPFTKQDWQNEIDWVVDTYFGGREALVLDQLRADGLFTNFSAPVMSQYGGAVPANYQLAISSRSGAVYYTTDGVTDPREIGGGVNPSDEVIEYDGLVTLTEDVTIRARVLTPQGVWSGLIEATFDVMTLAGDYDGSGVVDTGDHATWKANFGSIVQPGTGADGNGDGVVDAADYTTWRDNLGATLGLGVSTAASLEALVAEPSAAPSPSLGDSIATDAGEIARNGFWAAAVTAQGVLDVNGDTSAAGDSVVEYVQTEPAPQRQVSTVNGARERSAATLSEFDKSATDGAFDEFDRAGSIAGGSMEDELLAVVASGVEAAWLA